MNKDIIRRNHRGFSLVEILVAILLVGILMAVAVPRLLGSRQSAADSAAKQQLETVVNEAMSIMADQDSFTNARAIDLKALAPDITLCPNGGTAAAPTIAAPCTGTAAAPATELSGAVRGVAIAAPTTNQWIAAVRGGDSSTGPRCWVIELNKTTPNRYATYNLAAASTVGCSTAVPAVGATSTGFVTGNWPGRIS